MAQQPPPGNYPPPPGGQYPPQGPPPPGGFPPPGQGGFPPPGQSGQQGPGFGQKAAKAGGNILMRIVIAVVVLVVLGVGGWIFKNLTGDPDTAKTGDCVTNAASADDMKVVDCTDPSAEYKVIERVDDPSGTAEAACSSAADLGATDVLYSQKSNGDLEYVLCLGPTS